MEEEKNLRRRLKAAALKYDPSEVAPKVVAKGAGLVAEKIIEKGRDANLPVYKDEKLTEELVRLELGEYIPQELYDVVAQVLVFISDLDRTETYRRYAEQN